MDAFRTSFRALAGTGGRRVRLRPRADVFFASIEAARRLLTPSRLALLRAIRTKRPSSIYGLAQVVRRDLKNVQQDLPL